MLSFPLLQAILLSCCSVLACVHVIFSNPFQTRFEQAIQIFQELSVCTVYICTLYLLISDSQQVESAVITVNLIINFGCTIFMILKVLQLLWNVYKSYANKRTNRVSAVTSKVSSSATNNENNSSTNPIERELCLNSSLPPQTISRSNNSINSIMPNTSQIFLVGPVHERVERSELFEESSDVIKSFVSQDQTILFGSDISSLHPISPQKPQNMKRSVRPLSPKPIIIASNLEDDEPMKKQKQTISGKKKIFIPPSSDFLELLYGSREQNLEQSPDKLQRKMPPSLIRNNPPKDIKKTGPSSKDYIELLYGTNQQEQNATIDFTKHSQKSSPNPFQQRSAIFKGEEEEMNHPSPGFLELLYGKKEAESTVLNPDD